MEDNLFTDNNYLLEIYDNFEDHMEIKHTNTGNDISVDNDFLDSGVEVK